jgi:hypothetical protein
MTPSSTGPTQTATLSGYEADAYVQCPVTPPITANCVVINAVQGIAITPVTMTASGGAGGPYTFSATGLPPGLTMSSGGTISGTPTASGTFSYTVTITDSKGNKGTVKCSVEVSPPTQCAPSSNASNFNGTRIPSGDYIWFNANFTASGIPSTGATIFFQNSTVHYGATTLFVPNAQITFSPSTTCATTSFNTATNTWITTVPISGSDEIFLSGLSYPLTAPLAGGTNPVTWTGTFTSNTAGITVNWKWGAAVYTTFSTDYNLLKVKPTHSASCAYNNSDHAGTPEGTDTSSGKLFKSFVTGGARGGGGANFTGSWSGTVSVPVCH